LTCEEILCITSGEGKSKGCPGTQINLRPEPMLMTELAACDLDDGGQTAGNDHVLRTEW
jgi:hypothetical protein